MSVPKKITAGWARRDGNKKIITFFDTPHLLKNTRNALSRYNIRFSNNFVAKFQHIVDAYQVDKKKRFPMLYKIRECFLDINSPGNRALKMKVSVAAKTMSATVASAIETAIAVSPGTIPAEAIHTATFINDINDLFDSMNGNLRYKFGGNSLRCSITDKSRHNLFWESMMQKISSWQFECPKTGQIVDVKMKFHNGWINNIRAFRELWKTCKTEGFEYLRTRAVNQDCLENLFSVLRLHGMGNTNPSCYQFTAALKTSVLNNLVGSSKDKNCETDDVEILDNLEEFLDGDFNVRKPIVTDQANELLTLIIPDFDEATLNDGNLDTQGLAYVCGFFVKKIKTLECAACHDALLSQDLEPCHTFTSFKENDEKKRLKYVQKPLMRYIAHTYEVIYYFLSECGEISNVFQKIKISLRRFLDFSWFSCTDHFSEIQSVLLDCSITLITKKFLKEQKNKFQDENRQKQRINKMKRILHK
jgi:hypothetical protein